MLAALELRGEVGGRIDGRNTAAVDNHDAIAGHADFRQNVSRKNNGMAAGETLDEVADLDDLLGVEADGGLVKDNDLGIVHERLGQADALLISARQALDQLVALILDVRLLHGVVDAGFTLLRGNVFDAGDEVEISGDGHVHDRAADFRAGSRCACEPPASR